MGNKKSNIILYLILILFEILAFIKFLSASITFWEDISKGYISGSFLILARSGDPLWSFVIIASIIISLATLGIFLSIFYTFFKLYKTFKHIK